MSELPNPVNFAAASATVTEDDIRKAFAVGPDVETYVQAVQRYSNAGFDRIVLLNAGPGPDGFLTFFGEHLSERLRSLG
jgi:hypothetical protein